MTVREAAVGEDGITVVITLRVMASSGANVLAGITRSVMTTIRSASGSDGLAKETQSMVSIKKLACPFCDVRLRVADTLPAGKIITCPKCGEGFPVPDGNGDTPAPKAGTTPSSYRLSSVEIGRAHV